MYKYYIVPQILEDWHHSKNHKMKWFQKTKKIDYKKLLACDLRYLLDVCALICRLDV